MKLEKYIKDLLYRYECVIVPGFGAFLTHRKTAEIHQTTHAFYPPKKMISFNRQLNKSDGLLANYIANTEQISYTDAIAKIQKSVHQAFNALENHGEIVMEGVGKFYTDGEKILFQPSYHNNYLTDVFGMTSFIAEEVTRKASAAKTKEESPTIAIDTKKTTKEKEAYSPKKRSANYLKYAAVGIIAIGVSGFFTANWYTNTVKNHNLAEQQKAKNKVEQKIQQATFVIDNPLPEITFTVNRQKGKYHIVAGAFREKANAQKKIKQLQNEGYQAREIGVNNYGLHEVIYQSYENRLDALKALRTIKYNHNSEAWLLVKDLKKS